ncbi:uncharacterized protein LOC129593205 [Paramacrobiotus metropolitanus]|uniref:uncharacterized protein LOC129593205 n=1 Tax=Paramacrobiotus metropolitanus TaxID=2943436 RepID=UPI0024460D1E|nr:uncharacterized protein LOC129593205 [Paramacrobiotus metropolitanus]
MYRTLTVYGWLLCFWQPGLRCSARTTQTTTVTNSDQWRISTVYNAFHMIDRAMENMEDDMVTLQFPNTATTPSSSSPSGSVLRPHLGNTVSFWCPVPVGGHSSRISWTVQGRTVFERGQPVALPASQPHSHYEFAQLDDGTAVLRIRNVSLASSGEIVCRLDEAAKKTELRRFTLIPRVTQASEVFVEDLPPSQETVTGGTFNISCRVRLPLAPEVVENVRHHFMWRHLGRLLNAPAEEPYTTHLPASWTRTANDTRTVVDLWGRPIVNVTRGSPLAHAVARLFRTAVSNSGINVNAPGAVFAFHLNSTDADQGDIGPVECWFRPHRNLHEWIVQSTYLNVEP